MRFEIVMIVALALSLSGCSQPGGTSQKAKLKAQQSTDSQPTTEDSKSGDPSPVEGTPSGEASSEPGSGNSGAENTETPAKPAHPGELAGDCSEGLVFDAGIIGGKTVKAGSWLEKQTVFLYSRHVGACTGSIIAPDILLTAAHCVAKSEKGMTDASSTGIALFGSNPKCSQPQPAARITFRDVIVHPDYQEKEKGENDLALVRLQQTVPEGFGPGAIAPRAMFEKLLDSKTTFQTAGFGNTVGYHVQDQHFPRLRVVPMILMPQYGRGLDDDFAFDQKTGGFCAGDSGGPMFAKVANQTAIVGVNSIVVSRTGTEAEPCTDMSFAISIENHRAFLKKAFAEIAPDRKNPF